ncbi:MAG: CapA family protein [Anaerolineaceae bacterium]|nr:CapA family protein [Anaerolineaceae bacterium]
MNKLKHFLQTTVIIFLFLTGCSNQIKNSNTTTQNESIPVTDETSLLIASADNFTLVCSKQTLPDSFLYQLAANVAVSPCAERSTDIQFEISSAQPVSQWIYSLAAPFYTIDDDINFDLLKLAWQQGNQSGLMISHLMVDQSTYEVFTTLWGPAQNEFVLIRDYNDMKEIIRDDVTNWAIIPFEQIEPVWKIITVDGQSPIRKDFDLQVYPLQAPISILISSADQLETVNSLKTSLSIPPTNRDAYKLSTVLLTGVTALVRATANTMERRGMTYPADDIRMWFLDADIVHISNEIPFAENCPQPFPRPDELVFCSQTEYIELLESIDTDVVELSGDHFQDWGAEATLYTIELYKERGWQYYGGGVNLQDGLKPIRLETNGNKIAFIGCNAKGGAYAGATETNPGAAECDFDYMTEQIRLLREDGYLPIVTFQHLEYYTYKAHPILQEDFHQVADAGAVIVSGSQAHQPHAIELYNGAFLHYGLGNLFFDQLFESPETGQAFIDRHVFYDGKYLGTELLTIQFIDLAQSRPMTIEERQILLFNVFNANQH